MADDSEDLAKPSARADAAALHAALGEGGTSGEAAQYAPHWGRLHLKWGEALTYAGKKDEARKQLALIGHLFLTPFEKSELARVNLHV